jgi:hypothetical protein
MKKPSLRMKILKNVRLKVLLMSGEIGSLKSDKKSPLLEISQYSIGEESSDRLFMNICDILPAADGDIRCRTGYRQCC